MLMNILFAAALLIATIIMAIVIANFFSHDHK